MAFKRKNMPVNNIYKIILFAVILFMFCGCSRESEPIPNKPIVEGKQEFYINDYNIKEQGFSGIENTFRKNLELPEDLSISYFEAELSEIGEVQEFTLALDGFENKEYVGSYSFSYDQKENKLFYKRFDDEYFYGWPVPFDENNEITFLDEEIKRIPLEKQIQKLDFENYYILYNQDTRVEKGEPIIDGSNNKKIEIMGMDEYLAFEGGKSDGMSATYFTLYDGTSIVSPNLINFKLNTKNPETIKGNRNVTMQTDYRINDNNQIGFTRDYGETWLWADITEDELNDTLNFYQCGHVIPEQSYFLDENEQLPIALFYGGDSLKLSISLDNAKSWEKTELNPNWISPITHRIIRFIDETQGYMGLGTDWSMGTGEAKTCYFTNDSGQTWEQKDLPNSGSSNTLSGIAFADMDRGVVTLNTMDDTIVPLIYVTEDHADSWKESTLPLDTIPNEIQFLTKVDSLVYEDGEFTLTLGQGANGNVKAIFKSSSLDKGWKFIKSEKAVMHTEG